MKLRLIVSFTLFFATAWAQPAQNAQPPQTIRDPNLTGGQIRDRVDHWPECDEYKSGERCKVTINLGPTPQDTVRMPHAHWDVQVKPFIFLSEQPRGEAVVFLQQSSPFMQCTVAATPAAPTRDLSANIGTLLTAVGSVGSVPATNLASSAAPEEMLSLAAESVSKKVTLSASSPTLAAIEKDIQALTGQINDKNSPYGRYRAALHNDWQYTFATDKAASDAIDDLKAATAAALRAPLPDFAGYTEKTQALIARLNAYATTAPQSEKDEIAKDETQLTELEAEVSTVAGAMKDETARRKAMRQLYDFLWTINESLPLATQLAPMAYFSGKTVTETITCKDALSNNPAFDNIIFTAYYEGLPHFDISAGAVFSLLGGRQVGAVSQACTGSSCTPGTILTNTSKSWYQFMPGIFVEWRMLNFLPHWVMNGSPVHKLGYLWSFGPAAGVDINPNNGATEAEFFEGISLGIQRFAIMAGFHDGRYQQYTGGYYVGETFPSGTSVTPPTVRNWAVRPAFGIAYRIPIR
jgi:hypothetical protein